MKAILSAETLSLARFGNASALKIVVALLLEVWEKAIAFSNVLYRLIANSITYNFHDNKKIFDKK